MSERKHKLSEVIEFGEQLIKTNDLDPVYVALYGVVQSKGFAKGQLARLLLAYFLFYHLGASAALSEFEGDDFWDVVENAAANEIPPNMNGDWPGERWPRGTERRHFRGRKCVQAVQEMRKFSKGKSDNPDDPCAEYIIQLWTELGDLITLEGFMRSVQVLPLMGPWIAFKVADVCERVLAVPIEFPIDLALIYKEPRAALGMLTVPAERASLLLLQHFHAFKAPPRYERGCNIQETETVLCKWKSHVNGHYWVGKDIHEIRKGLKGWGETADKLLACMPNEVGREKGLFS